MALTGLQTLILWALLAKAEGGSFQKDIRPEVTKKDREALIKTGLISSEKRGRSLWLEVTEKGWAWAADNLDASLPKRSNASSAILQEWLTRLKAFMEARGFALADVLAPSPPPAPPDPHPISVRPRPAIDYPSVRSRIRQAYLELTGGRFNRRALLRDIRGKLQDVERSTLDQALKRMQREQEASLYQLDNRIEVTDSDRDAAIYFGSEPRHLLWIER